MGNLERRLRSLEAALAAKECPECGHDPRLPITDYDVVWKDHDAEDLGDESKEPKCCHGCGRQLEYIVVWDDIPPLPPERERCESEN